jgi:tRNA pseudouridine38-40 synthase
MTQRWKLTIEYDGTPFVGWQRQEHDLSVQSAIEKAIYDFTGETVTIHVAGRTDAGVHAVGQVAHVDLEKDTTEKTVRDAINAHLRPLPIAIVKAEPVSQEFHARFKALNRVYCYKMLAGRMGAPAIDHNRVWHVTWDMDVAAMHTAAQYLLGKHDFTSFRSIACQARSTAAMWLKPNTTSAPDGISRSGPGRGRSCITRSAISPGVSAWSAKANGHRKRLNACWKPKTGPRAGRWPPPAGSISCGWIIKRRAAARIKPQRRRERRDSAITLFLCVLCISAVKNACGA